MLFESNNRHETIARVFGFSALVGVAITGLAIAKMMRYQAKGNNELFVQWQRVRVVAQGLSLSLLTMPLVIPHLNGGSFLFRRE